MLPIQLQRRLSDKQGEVQLGVMLAETVVGTGPKHEKVLGSPDLGVARVVALRVELVGVGVDFGISQRHVCGGNHHST